MSANWLLYMYILQDCGGLDANKIGLPVFCLLACLLFGSNSWTKQPYSRLMSFNSQDSGSRLT